MFNNILEKDAVGLRRCVNVKVLDVTSRLHFLSMHSHFCSFFWAALWLRCLRSRLFWASSHVYCNQSGVVSGWDVTDLRTGELLSQGAKSDRGGEDQGGKNCSTAGAVSVLVRRKSWHELHLSVVMERISVSVMYEDALGGHSWRDPGVSLQSQWACSCALNVHHIKGGGCFHQVRWWGESRQTPLSLMESPY